ncbi:Antiholin-like protein LrgA [Peptoniphilus indolicus]|nr:CidA/LrgA family protein [Peptoniphilus indolicus]SUB74976.1 Antiholin-like protein LrgA [Peptoniphilus indolicus]
MNYLKQFSILLICLFMGVIVNYFFSTPIPMVVWGMIFLFLGLIFKVVSVSDIEETSRGLLKYFAFFFLPAGVEIMKEYASMDGKVLQILVIISISTIITLILTALVVEFVIRRLYK